jgi:hypothetical protein
VFAERLKAPEAELTGASENRASSPFLYESDVKGIAVPSTGKKEGFACYLELVQVTLRSYGVHPGLIAVVTVVAMMAVGPMPTVSHRSGRRGII